MDQHQARVNNLNIQLLVVMDSKLDDIMRLARIHPTDTYDDRIITMVMNYTAGMLLNRRGEAGRLEDEPLNGD